MATTRPLEDVLFVALQTVAQKASLEELSPRLQEAWKQKATYLGKPEEDLSPEELYAQQAALFAEFGRIVNISVGYFHKTAPEGELELRVKSMSAADPGQANSESTGGNLTRDERSLLEEFKNLLNERFDQNRLRLCAHNGKEFDFPYLSRRMLLHCVPIPPALDYAGKKPWEVPHLDTMEMWMFGNRRYFVPLDLLAAIFDIPVKEPILEGSEVGKVYYEEGDLQKIQERGQQDVITTAQLFMRYRCSPLLKDHQIKLV